MPESLIPPSEYDSNRPNTQLHAAAETPHVGAELKEPNIFESLIQSVRDAFFSPKLPPLVLESQPIYTKDPMATKMSRSSFVGSITFYVLLALFIAWVLKTKVPLAAPKKTQFTALDMAPPPPPPALKDDRMGGGGGQKGPTPVTQGRMPKFAQQQLLPPKAPPVDKAKLEAEPTVSVQSNMKMPDNNLANLGMPTSTLHGVSMGNGNGSGLGSGNGNGVGPGSGGNIGGGVMHIGGSVLAPKVIFAPDPEFSEEARKAKFSGDVQVYLIVDENGQPTHVKVVRGVGMGLDEKAIEAVRQYKFKPATQNGKPVKVDLYINVNFQIF